MKIHLISNMYPSQTAPNYGVFVKNTESILLESGFKVERTVLLKEKNKLLKLIKYLFYYLKIIIKGMIFNYDITYVHYASHNAIPVLLLKRLNKNTIIYTNVHGSDIIPQVPSQEKYQPYVKKLLKVSNTVITPSIFYQQVVQKKYNLSNRIEVFPSGGINTDIFYERAEKKSAFEELKIDPNYRYIGYVSRLDVGKGFDILLNSIKILNDENYLRMNNIKVIIVGDGLYKDKLFEIIFEYQLQDIVIHFPLLPQKNLNAIYNVIDVFCFPTKGESLGLVGLEAMACGTPVIGSAVGGLLDYIVDGKNGLLFQMGSEEDLARKIKYFYSLNQVQKLDMSTRAKEMAENYKVENIKHKLINIFKGSK